MLPAARGAFIRGVCSCAEASRQAAIRRAEARYPAVAAHLLETHPLLLPRHALYVAAFFVGLDAEERQAS